VKALKALELPVCAMHGRLEQSERNRIMKDFRDGKIRFLVTTDLMARGIDVQSLGVVFNYELPKDMPTYLHRSGRTGRMGRKGLCINLVVSKEDEEKIKEIEAFYKTKINKLTKETIDEWSKVKVDDEEEEEE